MNPVIETIFERRSIRSYKPEQISTDDLNTILDAGLWAPSARNAQEILFVVLQKQDILDELKDAFSKLVTEGGSGTIVRARDFIFGAPTFILLFGDKDFHFTDIDGGIAVQNMALTAESLGLGSVIIGCIRVLMEQQGNYWCEKFGIDNKNKFVIGIAIGYKNGDTPKRDRNDGRIFTI